jgi:hypothetical protein
MKSIQKYFVFGLFMTAGLIFAGCGDTASDSGTSTTESAAPAGDSDEGATETPDNASATETGDFQLVSLNVPNMT